MSAWNEVIDWYKIRDTFLGHNYVKQDIKKAIELAAVCKHPDAVWLTKLFSGCHIINLTVARNILLKFESDPRVLCLVAMICYFNKEKLHQAANLGNAFAQSKMGWAAGNRVEDCIYWAQKSAAQGERDGFYALGHCYQHGHGCDKNIDKAKENFLIAVNLGLFDAKICLTQLLKKNDTTRIALLGELTKLGYRNRFFSEIEEQFAKFKAGTGHTEIIFAIGRVFKENIMEQSIFSLSSHRLANQALHFYNFQLQSYRKAVDTWTIISKRYNVVKDIRKLIGMIVWESRNDAKYTE